MKHDAAKAILPILRGFCDFARRGLDPLLLVLGLGLPTIFALRGVLRGFCGAFFSFLSTFCIFCGNAGVLGAQMRPEMSFLHPLGESKWLS